MINFDTADIIKSITSDILLLNDIKTKEMLSIALFNALYAALQECEVTAKLAKNKDDFYSVNRLYIATLSIYLECLADPNATHLAIELEKLTDEDKKYIFEQYNIFIAIIAKLFRTARTITELETFNSLLPVSLWNENVKDLVDDKNKENNK